LFLPDPVDYRSPATDPPKPKRSAGKWLILAFVWIVGMIFWGLYLALAAVLLVRFL
jgi:hypothetical protein